MVFRRQSDGRMHLSKQKQQQQVVGLYTALRSMNVYDNNGLNHHLKAVGILRTIVRSTNTP